jgi:hypothetical protein
VTRGVAFPTVRRPKAGGGIHAIVYSVRAARKAGGIRATYRALRSRNACKTCALGMGGQLGGMVNEAGHFPEVCKKSIQAMTADMAGAIKDAFWENFDLEAMGRLTSRELEAMGRITKPMYAAPSRGTRRSTASPGSSSPPTRGRPSST